MRRYSVVPGRSSVAFAGMLALHGCSGTEREPGPVRATGPASSASRRGEARSRRDALRLEILRYVPERSAPPPGQAPNAARPALHEVQDKLKGSEKLAAALREKLGPLATSCIEQAEARAPSLFGLLAITVETLAHEKLGAVVEVADPAVTNEVGDARLIECVRESAFTVVIPPPLTSGRVNFELTFMVAGRNWR